MGAPARNARSVKVFDGSGQAGTAPPPQSGAPARPSPLSRAHSSAAATPESDRGLRLPVQDVCRDGGGDVYRGICGDLAAEHLHRTRRLLRPAAS